MLKFQSLLELDKCQLIINTIKDPLVLTFAFELLLQQLIKEKRPCLLILLTQNLRHYSAILMKCGINLKSNIDDGSIQIIDTFDYDLKFDFESFKSELNSKLTSLPERSFVLIDDIQVFDSLNVSVKKAYLLVKGIQKMIGQKLGAIFIGATLIPSSKSKWNMLINDLLHECDVWLDCDSPKTGYSQQINGLLRCFYQKDSSNIELNYKISNRDIIFTKL